MSSRNTPQDSRLQYVLRVGLAHLSIGCEGPSKRPRRSDRSEPAEAATSASMPDLAPVETDANERVVYANLHAAAQDDRFTALRASLIANRPTERVLERLTPINRNRLLVEIEDESTLARLSAWLRAVMADEVNGQALRRLLQPLGARLRLLGGQWIVPKATEYEPRIVAQTPHTDVDTKGEVVSIAIHVHGKEMGTLVDARARIGKGGAVVDGCGFGRANTDVFAYDTGAVHGGPGVNRVEGPYPRYFVDRVFFLFSSDSLAAGRIAQHRRDNNLRGIADMVVEV